MNKLFRIFKRLVFVVIVACLLGVDSIFYIKNRQASGYSEFAYDSFVKEINEAEELPHNVYVLSAFTPDSFFLNTTFEVILKTPFYPSNSCPCVDVSDGFVFSTLDKWTLGLNLDQDVSPKRCFDYYVQHFDFLNNAIGIRKASELYFGEELEKLSNDKLLQLLVMLENPAVYNLKTNFKNNKAKTMRYLIKQ